ncbi:uncharacterized protein LOC142985604 [Anticarsia gemmatalis]|uniref:uncharacterized protein LOC142985604 n=1 Tax=Anticarsia gemmatalis TaxID=129554 RepID=UPI003F7643AF
MAMSFKLPDVEYVLPYDCIDMAYINRVLDYKHSDRVLMSKAELDGVHAYVQVQVVSEEAEENEDYVDKEAEKYMCHTCNKEVPHKYYKEHIQSKKHQNFTKMVDKIVENSFKELQHNEKFGDDVQSFYCSSCCEAVLEENKFKHYSSTLHLQSIENDKIAEQFLNMYFEDQFDNVTETDENTIEGSAENLNLDSSEVQQNFCETRYFERYLKEMIVKYYFRNQLHINIELVDDSIYVVTSKGDKQKVTLEGFHGYKEIHGTVYCQICCTRVNDPEAHSRTELHINSVTRTIDDNFARKINDRWNHCLVCNEQVRADSDHVIDDQHKTLLANTAFKQNPEHTYFFTIHLDSQNFTINKKINTPISERNDTSNLAAEKKETVKQFDVSDDESDVSNIDLVFEEPIAHDGKYYSYCKQFTFFGNNVHCNVCKSAIVHVPSKIVDHVESSRHKEAVSKLFKQNKISVIAKVPLYHCEFCDMLVDNFMSHIQCPEHSNWTNINKKSNINKLNDYIYVNKETTEEAVMFRRMFQKLLVRNKMIKQGDSCYCRICELIVHESFEIRHMFSDLHRGKLKEYLKMFIPQTVG